MEEQTTLTKRWFHDKYIEKFGRLNARKADSELIYSNIIRAFFDYVQEKLYAGKIFRTPVGIFAIRRIYLNPDKLRVTHAATNLANREVDESQKRIVYRDKKKPYFHTLKFTPIDGLEKRYLFACRQPFSRKIHEHYE